MILSFLLFLTYSILGWLIEVIVCTIETKKFVNRGFLIGPYCPLYGVSALLMVWFLHDYKNDLLILFAMSIFICSVTEYITSYTLEKIFKARWWDYRHLKLNINGRVCMINSIVFGILGILLIVYINPFLLDFYNRLPHIILYCVFAFTFILFTIDCFISFKVVKRLKFTAEAIKKDYTDEISSRIREVLFNQSVLIRRISKAFPTLVQTLIGKKRHIKSKKNN